MSESTAPERACTTSPGSRQKARVQSPNEALNSTRRDASPEIGNAMSSRNNRWAPGGAAPSTEMPIAAEPWSDESIDCDERDAADDAGRGATRRGGSSRAFNVRSPFH